MAIQTPELTREAEQALYARNLEAAVTLYGTPERPSEAYPVATTRKLLRALIGWRGLSVKQWDLLRKCLDEIALGEKYKHCEPCPSGRHTITGKIITIKAKETPQGIVHKMMIRAEQGYRVYCTLPKAFECKALGDVITFACTLEPSGDDPRLGWGSRPTVPRTLA